MTEKTTASGKDPVTQEGSVPNPERLPDGQHVDHWVLNDEERAKGFIRPVRRSYVHSRCGGTTSMGLKIAETYARRPSFYGSTFCSHCGDYFPVGEHGEFTWVGLNEKVGT